MAFLGNEKGGSDEYYTPKYIFDALGCEFDMDVACPEDLSFIKTPAKQFIISNSLDVKWNGFVWMNPPFSGRNGKSLWLSKIHEHGSGIGLMPDRTSAPWWPVAAKQSCALFSVTGKIKFLRPDGTSANQPGSGTTLFAYGKRGVEALKNAEKNGLGLVLRTNESIVRYTREVAQHALNNASKNVKVMRGGESFIFGIDLNSITDPSNIQL